MANKNDKIVTDEGLIVDLAPDMDRWGNGNRLPRQGVASIERSPRGRLWAAFRVEYSREEDIIAGEFITDGARSGIPVNNNNAR